MGGGVEPDSLAHGIRTGSIDRIAEVEGYYQCGIYWKTSTFNDIMAESRLGELYRREFTDAWPDIDMEKQTFRCAASSCLFE